MQNYQSITLDVNNCVEYKYINAKQGDIASRFLKITLTDNGKAIVPTSKCTVSFRCLKPDGRICVNKSVKNTDGTITVELTEQVLSSAGTVRADISLLDGSTVLSSATFFIVVEASPAAEGNVLSSDEFLILVETTNQAISAIHSIEDISDEIQAYLNKTEDIKAFIGYTDEDILGLCVDYENKMFTRLAGAAGLNAGTDFDGFPMYGGMKRCNVEDDGTISAFYGDADYADDGSNGQVMVYVPKFYYKVVPLKLDKNTSTGIGYHIRKANYYISDTPKMGFKLHPAFYDEEGNEVDYFLYSAYEGSLWRTAAKVYYNDAVASSTTLYDTDLICSAAGRKPISGQHLEFTSTLAENYCKNRGAGWHCESIKSLSALQFLMMIEYGTMNLQTALGQGVTYFGRSDSEGSNFAATTGATANLGNKSGEASVTTFNYFDPVAEQAISESLSVSRKQSCSYRGVENPFGNLNRFIQGINIYGDGSMGRGQPFISADFNYNPLLHSETYEGAGFTVCADSASYISALGYGNEKYDWLFIASESGSNGTSSFPVSDKWYCSPVEQVNGHLIMRHGLAWNYGYGCGMFAGASSTTYTSSGCSTGCRLIYLPQN